MRKWWRRWPEDLATELRALETFLKDMSLTSSGGAVNGSCSMMSEMDSTSTASSSWPAPSKVKYGCEVEGRGVEKRMAERKQYLETLSASWGSLKDIPLNTNRQCCKVTAKVVRGSGSVTLCSRNFFKSVDRCQQMAPQCKPGTQVIQSKMSQRQSQYSYWKTYQGNGNVKPESRTVNKLTTTARVTEENLATKILYYMMRKL